MLKSALALAAILAAFAFSAASASGPALRDAQGNQSGAVLILTLDTRHQAHLERILSYTDQCESDCYRASLDCVRAGKNSFTCNDEYQACLEQCHH